MRRSELYQLVWSEPNTSLAPRLGCSASWLKRLCVDHAIPTPGRGYWAKLKAGVMADRDSLPPGEDSLIPIALPAETEPPSKPAGELAETPNGNEPRHVELDMDRSPSSEVPSLDAELSAAIADAMLWHQHQQLREYTMVLEANAARLDPIRRNALLVWIQAVQRRAAEVDPVSRSVERASRILGGADQVRARRT